MIILTEIAVNLQTPQLLSDGLGVWRYSFGGDEAYIDDLGEEFFWPNRIPITNIRGVRFGTVSYTEVASLAVCRSNPATWYWESASSRIYIHHENSENNFHKWTTVFVLAIARAGYATGRIPGQNQYFPNLFFDPIISNIGGLKKQVDPLAFGLLSFESSSFDLINSQSAFDDFSALDSYNAQIIFVLMREGQTDINNGKKIFSGFTGGARIDDDTISVTLSESRTFYNRNVCPTLFNTTTYPSLDSKFENKRVPVAYGDIRKGIAVPIDSDGIETGDAATITFKLADESIHAIRAVTALYDSNGDSVTLGTINLTACTVEYAKPAGKEVDLAAFTWAGEGYDIPGTYNNGLDIIKDAFVEQAAYVYTTTTFDTVAWEEETIQNAEAVGISIQSERGIIEEIVEPLTVSLQGIVDVLGDGRITFRSRNTDAASVKDIYQYEIIEGPEFVFNVDQVVSSITVDYAPNFFDRDDRLTAIYDEDETDVVSKYGIKTSRPISPVETVLFTEADALSLAAEISTTTSDPEQIVTVTIPLDEDEIQIFDIVQCDVSRPHAEPKWRVFEVLGFSPSFRNGQHIQQLRLRLLPDREASFEERIITEDGEDIITELTLEPLTTET